MQENNRPTVTMVETPSESIINKNNAAYTIYDERSREIVLKKPNVLDQFRIVEVVGPETAKNEVYMAMIMPILYVASIDKVPAIFGTKSELEALISRLGEDGVSTVFNGVKDHFSKEDQAGKEEIKKS